MSALKTERFSTEFHGQPSPTAAELSRQARDEVFAEFPCSEQEIAKSQPRPRKLAIQRSDAISRFTASPAQSQQNKVAGRQHTILFDFPARVLGVAVFLFTAALLYNALRSDNRLAKSAPSRAPAKSALRKIEDARLGQRTVGRNPIREQAALIEPDPATWRAISLHLRKRSGKSLWVELLRPLDWIEEHEARVNGLIYLELPEMGAVGEATVLAIAPCPEIQRGNGAVITGTFKHEADENSNVVHLQLEGQAETTGVTANHPYWSVDRQEFVPVGKLSVGEQVNTDEGPRRVVAVTPVAYSGFLYNLETTEHVYRVGTLGTLVHNSCVIHGKPQPTSPAHAKAMQDMANRMANSGAYTDVYMHSKWTTILQGKGVTVSPNQLPDVAGIRLDGKIDIIEFASSLRDYKYGNLLGRNRDIWNQLPQHLRGDILVYDELGNWTQVFP